MRCASTAVLNSVTAMICSRSGAPSSGGTWTSKSRSSRVRSSGIDPHVVLGVVARMAPIPVAVSSTVAAASGRRDGPRGRRTATRPRRGDPSGPCPRGQRRPQHRDRPDGLGAEPDARPHRHRAGDPSGQRKPGPSVRRRCQSRVAHSAGRDSRLHRIVPPAGVERATTTLRAAEAARRRAVLTALDAGWSITKIAELAGLSRQGVYNIRSD